MTRCAADRVPHPSGNFYAIQIERSAEPRPALQLALRADLALQRTERRQRHGLRRQRAQGQSVQRPGQRAPHQLAIQRYPARQLRAARPERPAGFLDPNSNLRLSAGAAARDAGDPSSYPARDIDGQARSWVRGRTWGGRGRLGRPQYLRLPLRLAELLGRGSSRNSFPGPRRAAERNQEASCRRPARPRVDGVLGKCHQAALCQASEGARAGDRRRARRVGLGSRDQRSAACPWRAIMTEPTPACVTTTRARRTLADERRTAGSRASPRAGAARTGRAGRRAPRRREVCDRLDHAVEGRLVRADGDEDHGAAKTFPP